MRELSAMFNITNFCTLWLDFFKSFLNCGSIHSYLFVYSTVLSV